MLPRFPLVPAAAVLLLAGAPIPAAQAQPVVVGADQRAGLALTVYEGGFALVHDQRQADLPSGAATIVLSDLSDRLDTTTIRLAAGEGSQIRSLTFERETLSSAALLRRALGKTVRIGRVNPATGEETFEEAEVLAVSPELVVRIADRIETAIPGRVVFDGVPDDLRPAPGIAANLSLPAAGERTLSLSYLTDGLSWKTSYVGRLADGADRTEARASSVSARNRLVGIVTDVRTDAVMAQVELICGPYRVVSLLSADAVRDLGLAPGVRAIASVKSTNVVLERP